MSRSSKNKTKTKAETMEPIYKSKNMFHQLNSTDETESREEIMENKDDKKVVDNIKVTNNLPNTEGWTVQKKKKVNKPNIVIKQNSPKEVLPDDGSSLKLPSTWNVWIHLNNSSNWTPDSYEIALKIDNVSTFWKFVNNIHNLDLDKYQFYIMKENSCPTWEHESNRNGGTCSLRLPRDKLDEVIEQLCILVINDTFNNNPDDINGISFYAKISWGMIKIWNKESKNDISSFVPTYLVKKYSATPRYIKNVPEY